MDELNKNIKNGLYSKVYEELNNRNIVYTIENLNKLFSKTPAKDLYKGWLK